MITSVFPVKVWKDCISDITVTDSVLDRIVPRAWRIDLKSPSMRSRIEGKAIEDPFFEDQTKS